MKTLPPRLTPRSHYTVPPRPRESATADPFYSTREWRDLVSKLKAERGERCESPSCETPDRGAGNIVADHIRERKDGGAPLDPANVQLLCHTCHRRKTMAAAVDRLRFGGDEVDWADERRRRATKDKPKGKGEIGWGCV